MRNDLKEYCELRRTIDKVQLPFYSTQAILNRREEVYLTLRRKGMSSLEIAEAYLEYCKSMEGK